MVFSFFWPPPHLVSMGWLCSFAEGLSCHRWSSPQAHHLSYPETSLSLWPFRATAGSTALFKHCPRLQKYSLLKRKVWPCLVSCWLSCILSCFRLSTLPRPPALWGPALPVFLADPPGLASGSDTRCPLNERACPQVGTHMCSCRQTDTLAHTHAKASTGCGSLESSEL